MIVYNRGGIYHLVNVFKTSGSVFPKSFLVAAPCAAFAGILRYLIDKSDLVHWLREDDSILSNSQAFTGFNFLMGFLIVFRTSEAFTRFWEGTTATHRMRAEWFDAASAVMAFCYHSRKTSSSEDVDRFKQILTRLFSILHSAALSELDLSDQDAEAEQMRGFQLNVLDPKGLDDSSLAAIKEKHDRVELVFSWIQKLIVSEIGTGVLTIPPPILSRAFQELSNGMVAFHEARKIATVPFPFPYAQTCDCLLLMHWLLVPFVTTQWVKSYIWCSIFVFIQVFILWTLNFIAVEIEDPFGCDDNDLDGTVAQEEFNRQLILLLDEDAAGVPTLSDTAVKIENSRDSCSSMADALNHLHRRRSSPENSLVLSDGALSQKVMCESSCGSNIAKVTECAKPPGVELANLLQQAAAGEFLTERSKSRESRTSSQALKLQLSDPHPAVDTGSSSSRPGSPGRWRARSPRSMSDSGCSQEEVIGRNRECASYGFNTTASMVTHDGCDHLGNGKSVEPHADRLQPIVEKKETMLRGAIPTCATVFAKPHGPVGWMSPRWELPPNGITITGKPTQMSPEALKALLA